MAHLAPRFVLAVWVLAVSPLPAVEPAPEDAGHVFVSIDNDLFVLKDNDYTSGAAIGWFSAPVERWDELSGFAWVDPFVDAVPGLKRIGTRKAISLDAVQNIFTPADLSLDPPDPTDRPYCGTLLATLGIHQLDATTLTILDLSVGVVGPLSGAEQAQRLAHASTNSEEPYGWDYQIPNGLLLNAGYEQRWCLGELGRPYQDFGADALFGATAMLGSYRTSALVDVGFRFGYRMIGSYGMLSSRLGSEGRLMTLEPTEAWGWQAGFTLAGEAVAHDVSLDGRLFSDDETNVDHEPFVGRLALVLGGHVSRLQLYLLVTFSSPTFEQEDERSHYGRIVGVWTL